MQFVGYKLVSSSAVSKHFQDEPQSTQTKDIQLTVHLPDLCLSTGLIREPSAEISYKYSSLSGSSVGIATDYGLDGPGSNPGGDKIFPPVQTGPGAHPASCKMGTGSFPGVKCDRGVLLTTHPLLVSWSRKSRAIPLPTPWATAGL